MVWAAGEGVGCNVDGARAVVDGVLELRQIKLPTRLAGGVGWLGVEVAEGSVIREDVHMTVVQVRTERAKSVNNSQHFLVMGRPPGFGAVEFA